MFDKDLPRGFHTLIVEWKPDTRSEPRRIINDRYGRVCDRTVMMVSEG
jgi:hypothetical protein